MIYWAIDRRSTLKRKPRLLRQMIIDDHRTFRIYWWLHDALLLYDHSLQCWLEEERSWLSGDHVNILVSSNKCIELIKIASNIIVICPCFLWRQQEENFYSQTADWQQKQHQWRYERDMRGSRSPAVRLTADAGESFT